MSHHHSVCQLKYQLLNKFKADQIYAVGTDRNKQTNLNTFVLIR